MPSRAPILAFLAITLGPAGCAGDRPSAPAPSTLASIARTFPAAEGLFSLAHERQATERTRGGFALSTPARQRTVSRSRRLVRAVGAELPPTADAPFTLTLGDRPLRIGVRRLGEPPTKGVLDGGAVVYASPTSDHDAMLFSRGADVEELILVKRRGAALVYALDLPPGFSLDGARFPGLVEVKDARGIAWMRMRATDAWDARGAPVAVTCAAQGHRIALTLGSVDAWPVLVDPTWSSSTNDIVRRRDHTATALLDGRVLIAGGRILTAEGGLDPNQVSTPAEIFDPDTGTFTLVSAPYPSRWSHTATLLQNGEVLLAGGFSLQGAALATTDLFNPKTATFVTGTLPSARAAHTATLLHDGQVLVSAPRDPAASGSTSSADLFDPAKGVVKSATMVHARSRYTATRLPDGDVLFAGDASGALLPAEIFDQKTSSFQAIATPLSPHGCGAAVLLASGQVLLAGGGCTTPSGAAELFDPMSGTFTPTGSLITPRASFAANAMPNGMVLVTGGVGATGALDTAEIYDPATSAFTQEPMPDVREGHTATALPTDGVLIVGRQLEAIVARASAEAVATTPPPVVTGRTGGLAVLLTTGKVLIAGGSNASMGEADAEVYDPAVGSFAFAAASPRPLHDPTVALLAYGPTPSGRVLFAGGSNTLGVSVSASTIFDPATSSFVPTGSLGTPRARAAAVMLPNEKVLVVGGVGGAGQALATTESYEPGTGTFGGERPMHVARGGPVAVLLLDGTVLVAGGDTGVAEIYDTDARAYRTTKGVMVSPRDGPFATLLGSGEVLLAGPDASTELYDPGTETFRPGPPLGFSGAPGVVGAILPTGRMLLGARDGSAFVTFDPATNDVVPVTASPSCAPATATLMPTGGVLVSCNGATAPPAVWSEFGLVPQGSLPSFSSTPARVLVGTAATTTGQGFAPASEASGGTTSQSAANFPQMAWVPLVHSAVLRGLVTSWSASGATWEPPITPIVGPGILFPATGAGVGPGRLIRLDPAARGTPCATGYDCATNYCADGVCCDTACSTVCMACSYERNGIGPDGTCQALADGVADDRCAKEASVCGQNGKCDGAGKCAVEPPGTSCGDHGSCMQGVCRGSKCSSNADCPSDEVCFSSGTCDKLDATPGAAPNVGCTASRTDASDGRLVLAALVALAYLRPRRPKGRRA
jgi:hypothetical protein